MKEILFTFIPYKLRTSSKPLTLSMLKVLSTLSLYFEESAIIAGKKVVLAILLNALFFEQEHG